MDNVYQQIMSIATVIISGIDITAIISIVIYTIRQNVKNKKAFAKIYENMTKMTDMSQEQIQNAFKEAILPKNIRLDVSSKIETPIRNGLDSIKTYLEDTMKRVETGEQLILSILSLFSHVKKLPTDIQEQIEDYLETNTIEEIKIE